MAYYTIANGIIAGICFGFGIIFLFSGLRRRENKEFYLLFAVFALSYAATLLNGIRFHNATSVEGYIAITRWDAVFVVLAFSSLIWYTAEYTQVRPRIFLWGLTALFILTGLANITRTNLLFDQILGLNTVRMPWGEEVAYLETTDSVWSLLFLAGQLAALVFMVFACIRQYLGGQRRDALILSIGVLWFVASIVAEILGQAGLIAPIFYGEFGFLGFVVAISLQMSNEIIAAEEELGAYRQDLEVLVSERTAELEAAQDRLMAQAIESAAAEERGRLARELHDVVTQILFSINLIAISLPRLWKQDPVMAESSTNELHRLTRGALAEMRILLRELRPQTIVATDLGTLLTQLSHSVSARHDVPSDLQISRQCKLPEEVHVALYRIAQEVINNITKHAEASSISMKLMCTEAEAWLAISDDGKGFDQVEVTSDHMGLDIMRERAAAIGAELSIESVPGAGTTVAVKWPAAQAGESTDA